MFTVSGKIMIGCETEDSVRRSSGGHSVCECSFCTLRGRNQTGERLKRVLIREYEPSLFFAVFHANTVEYLPLLMENDFPRGLNQINSPSSGSILDIFENKVISVEEIEGKLTYPVQKCSFPPLVHP